MITNSYSPYPAKIYGTAIAGTWSEGHRKRCMLTCFYGFRRSEIVGLKWSAIDFDRKTITIRHTVTEVAVDGKYVTVAKDRTKTKSSFRTLPLVGEFEDALHKLREVNERNQKICGDAYCMDYLDYIFVNAVG